MMKTLCIALALIGQFEVKEIGSTPAVPQIQSSEFVVTEIAARSVDNRPTFDLLIASWCGNCPSVKNALSRLDKDTLPFKYRLWDVDTNGWQDSSSIPAFSYAGKTFQYGFSNPENLMRNYEKIFSTAKAIQRTSSVRLTSAQLKAFAASYRGEPYGVDNGDYWGHLQDWRHGFQSWQLNGLTQAECAKIHAGCHWGYLTHSQLLK